MPLHFGLCAAGRRLHLQRVPQRFQFLLAMPELIGDVSALLLGLSLTLDHRLLAQQQLFLSLGQSRQTLAELFFFRTQSRLLLGERFPHRVQF